MKQLLFVLLLMLFMALHANIKPTENSKAPTKQSDMAMKNDGKFYTR